MAKWLSVLLRIKCFWVRVQLQSDKIDTTIKFCISKLVFVSNFFLNNLEFLDQICPGKIFIVKIKKSEHDHWIPLIQISVGTKFQVKLTTFFWTDLPKKGFSCLKQKKWTIHIFYIILNIQISLVQNFSSKYELRLRICIFLDQICTKRYFQSKTEKVNIIIEFRIFKLVSWYQISALTDNFDFFDQIYPKRVFLV